MSEAIHPGWEERARQRMKALKVGVTSLSKAAGYASHVQTSLHLSKNRTRQPPWESLSAYAVALSCTPEWLARGEGEAPPTGPQQPEIFHAFGTEKPELTTLGQRALYVRATTRLNQADFARRLGITGLKVSRQAVRKIEADEVKDPSCRIMCAYEELTGFKVRWILTGRGEQRVRCDAPELKGVGLEVLASALQALRDAEQNPMIQRLPIRAKAELLRSLMTDPA